MSEAMEWTFSLVEERLVEAWGFFRRLPDREGRWLRIAGPSVWNETIYDYWDAGWQNTDKPVRIGLRSHEVDAMEEALGWIDWVPAGQSRRVLGLALDVLARGANEVSWGALCRPLGWGGHPDALRKRYDRAIQRICERLNRAAKMAENCGSALF